MEKLSIANLVPNYGGCKPLDVKSLLSHLETKKDNKEYDINLLMTSSEDDSKTKVLEAYEKVYHICMNKIFYANKYKNKNIICEFPKAMFGYKYKVNDCAIYVENKLKEINIETLLLKDNYGDYCGVYVCWSDLGKTENKK